MSFDMPERHGRNELKDYLVPDSLRSARRLVLGDTRRTLASELQGLPQVDLFNHDSWHAFSHMMWEFLIADKHLSPGGVLCSHDVLETPRRPNAFPLFADARDYTYGVFRNFGVARKPGMRVSARTMTSPALAHDAALVTLIAEPIGPDPSSRWTRPSARCSCW